MENKQKKIIAVAVGLIAAGFVTITMGAYAKYAFNKADSAKPVAVSESTPSPTGKDMLGVKESKEETKESSSDNNWDETHLVSELNPQWEVYGKNYTTDGDIRQLVSDYGTLYRFSSKEAPGITTEADETITYSCGNGSTGLTYINFKANVRPEFVGLNGVSDYDYTYLVDKNNQVVAETTYGAQIQFGGKPPVITKGFIRTSGSTRSSIRTGNPITDNTGTVKFHFVGLKEDESSPVRLTHGSFTGKDGFATSLTEYGYQLGIYSAGIGVSPVYTAEKVPSDLPFGATICDLDLKKDLKKAAKEEKQAQEDLIKARSGN